MRHKLNLNVGDKIYVLIRKCGNLMFKSLWKMPAAVKKQVWDEFQEIKNGNYGCDSVSPITENGELVGFETITGTIRKTCRFTEKILTEEDVADMERKQACRTYSIFSD